MSTTSLAVTAADGAAEGFLRTPEGAGPWPGVIYLPDIFGIRPATQQMAAHVAAQGFAVLEVNIFYRTDALPLLDFPFEMGETRSMRRLSHLLSAINADQMTRDGAAYADFLLAQPRVKTGKVGIVGYCFTGQMALRTAAAAPDKIAAAASFHGGRLVTDEPDSPHTLIPKVQGELYFGHAIEDQSMTPDAIEKLDLALKGWGGPYTSEIYEGAKHGWAVPDRPVYNPQQSARHYEKLFGLLRRTLG